VTLEGCLSAGLIAQKTALAPAQQESLLNYRALIERWNKVHNLTAVRDPQEMITLHLLDSLVVLPYLGQGRMLDVGSGAGLPGIPLAIARPDLQVTLMDSNHKKASFQRQAKAVLGLENVTVQCGRVESYRSDTLYDMIVSRAFSEIGEFIRLTRHLLKPNGVWLAMKGAVPDEELASLSGIDSTIIPLKVSGLAAQRHLVILKVV